MKVCTLYFQSQPPEHGTPYRTFCCSAYSCIVLYRSEDVPLLTDFLTLTTHDKMTLERVLEALLACTMLIVHLMIMKWWSLSIASSRICSVYEKYVNSRHASSQSLIAVENECDVWCCSYSVQLRRAQEVPWQGAREMSGQRQGKPWNKGIPCTPDCCQALQY